MASEILNLSALCRCCHIDGNFRHLDKTYTFKGQIENYSAMLIECFGLLLSEPAIEASHTICDVCIEKLRNALEFKKQVEQCEKKFENYCKNEVLLQSKLKIESSSDYEVTIKPEIQIKIEDSYGQSPIHEYPELDSFKVSDDEQNLNHDDGSEETDVKQDCYLETDIPPSITPHLNHKEPQLKEGYNEHKINYLQTDTPKSNLNVKNKDVKQVTKKNKSGIQQKITKIRGDNGLKKEKLNESGPENKESGQNEHNSKNITDLNIDPYPCVSSEGTYKTVRQLKRHIQRKQRANTPKSCSICKGIYKTEKTLTLHMAKKHSKMTCTICDKDFDSKQLWYNHHRNEHEIYLACKERAGQFVCSECGATVKRRSALRRHMMRKHTNTRPKKVFTCDVCKKDYANRTTIIKHIAWFHSATAPIKKYMCDICGFTIKDLTHLRIHIDTVHKKLKPYKCNLCPKAYAANKHLKVHLRYHTGERPYECPFCDGKYISYASLKHHVKRYHNPNLGQQSSLLKTESDQKFDFSSKYRCQICCKGFDKRSEITAHSWTHTGSKPYKCDCGKDFISKYTYKRHIKLHMSEAPERVPCEICHKTFSCKAPMQRHMRTVHEQQRGPKVKCEVCKILVWDMEKHIMKKHSGNCHQCEFCPRSYTEKGTLNRHIKERHSGVDNNCKLCGKKYIKLWSLRKHMAKKHNSV